MAIVKLWEPALAETGDKGNMRFTAEQDMFYDAS